MRRSLFSLCALNVLLIALTARAQDTPPVPPVKPDESKKVTPNVEINPEELAQKVVELTNVERAKKKLPPLKLQSSLHDSALWMAQDMAEYNYFKHIDRKGRDADQRIAEFEYADPEAMGENIAGGQTTPAEAVAAWMKSPGHRENLLSRDFREIGVGYEYNENTRLRHYWVQDFGSRNDVYPIVINGEAAQTHSPEVSLYIYGEGWAKEMRLSNDGENWTKWEKYRPNRKWTLEEGSGTRAVSVELRAEDETVRRASDTIELVPEMLLTSDKEKLEKEMPEKKEDGSGEEKKKPDKP